MFSPGHISISGPILALVTGSVINARLSDKKAKDRLGISMGLNLAKH